MFHYLGVLAVSGLAAIALVGCDTVPAGHHQRASSKRATPARAAPAKVVRTAPVPTPAPPARRIAPSPVVEPGKVLGRAPGDALAVEVQTPAVKRIDVGKSGVERGSGRAAGVPGSAAVKKADRGTLEVMMDE